MKFAKKIAFAALIASSLFGASAQASLIGQNISGTGITLTQNMATIGAGDEFSGIINYLKFDFGIDTLTVRNTTGVSWSGFQNYVFTGFGGQITGLSIQSNNGFSGGIVSNFAYTANSITLDMNAGQATVYPGSLVFKIAGVNEVPEPGSLALFGLAIAGAAAARRAAAKRRA
jgi:hypothetical protein